MESGASRPQQGTSIPPEPGAISEIVARLPSAARAAGVTEAMTRSIITVDPEMDVLRVMRLFIQHGISGAPVVDSEGKPLGVVSKADIVRALAERRRETRHFLVESEPEQCVGDIMMPLAIFVSEDSSVAHAAAVMAYERIHRVLVLDPRRKVVGLVSAIDVLGWLARNDGFQIP